MQLTEVAGIHHNAYRSLGSSLILDESQTIKLVGNHFNHSLIGIDHIHLQLEDVESIEITIGRKYVRFIEYKEMSFIKRVRRAFINWIEENILLRDYLKELPISQAMIKKIKRNGDFLVNGNSQTVRYLLQKGDCLEIIFPQETSLIQPENIPLKIVYEDDYYLIIDKESQMPCIPTKRYQSHTLCHALMYYYQQIGLNSTIHLVNRLDKETSGYMLVAKSGQAHAMLSKDIKQVKRVYHCLVEGILEGEGVIDQPILKSEDSIKRIVSDKGKSAKTFYKVLAHHNQQTLVECKLVTGRTHQIRVHMASIGHPLVGDELYGSKEKQLFYLESVEISFIHPFTNQEIHYKK